MSRSFKHTPSRSNGGVSEKKDKQTYNRCLRMHVRQNLHNVVVGGVDDTVDSLVLPEVRDVSNPWSMNKDGKHFSSSLAHFADTLGRVTRVRDGRRRTMLVLTGATEAAVEATNEHQALLYWWASMTPVRRDALDYISGMRK